MSSMPYKLLIVLFFISRRQFLPSTGTPEECLVKPAHHVLEVKPASPRFELKSCKMFRKRHYDHNRAQAVFSGPGHDISTYITSRDSTCTRTERLLVMRKREKLEKAALREIYSHSRAITEIKDLAGSTNCRVSLLRDPQKLLWKDFKSVNRVDLWEGTGCGASRIDFCSRL